MRWEEIQAANDLTDGAVGAAKDALAAASVEAEVKLEDGDRHRGDHHPVVAAGGLRGGRSQLS